MTKRPARSGSLPVKTPHGLWIVKRGFAEAMRILVTDHASPEVLSDMLLQVGIDAKPETVSGWSMEHRCAAELWATRVYLSASDNPVRVPPRPRFLPAPWCGPESGGEPSIWDTNATPMQGK